MADTQNILINQAQAIVDRFGSQARLAQALGHRSGTTVQTWLKAGYIRPKHYSDILEAAKTTNVPLKAQDFQLVDPTFFEQKAA